MLYMVASSSQVAAPCLLPDRFELIDILSFSASFRSCFAFNSAASCSRFAFCTSFFAFFSSDLLVDLESLLHNDSEDDDVVDRRDCVISSHTSKRRLIDTCEGVVVKDPLSLALPVGRRRENVEPPLFIVTIVSDVSECGVIVDVRLSTLTQELLVVHSTT